MYTITGINENPYQQQTVFIPAGGSVTFVLQFVQLQYGWFFRSISYNSFLLENLRVTVSPNMLHQFRNQIPFGLSCVAANNREPSQQQDFSSGAAILYLLSQAEVNQYAEFLSGQQIS